MIVAPISNLLHKNMVFKWEERHQEAFEKLQKLWCECIPLKSFEISGGHVKLTCDASLVGLGAVLEQTGEGDVYYPI